MIHTYSHFKIHDRTRSHAIKFPIHFHYKDRLAICCLTFSFSIVYYGKQGLDTFDDGYVDGNYLLKLNQEAVQISVTKKCTLL